MIHISYDRQPSDITGVHPIQGENQERKHKKMQPAFEGRPAASQ